MSFVSLPAASQPGSRLDRMDPRLRVVVTLLFALTTASLHSLGVVAVALGCAWVFVWIARLDLRSLLRRICALEGFMLLMLVMLPFSTPGIPMFGYAGWTASWEGFLLALTIILKANAVTFTALALVGTLEPESLGHAMAKLGMPQVLVQLFLLSVRYIGVFQEEHHRIRRAMQARGFVPRGDCHTWRSFGWLFGMLLVRSFERSQRVLAAMKCRGFTGQLPLFTMDRWQRCDTAALGMVSIFLIGLTYWEHFL